MTREEILAKLDTIKKNNALPEKQKGLLIDKYEKMLAEAGGEEPKETPAPKEKKERKPRAPKATVEKKPTSSEYDCDDLIEDAKERKAKALAAYEKRKNAPKKSATTKSKEAVAKAEKTVEKGVKKGEISIADIDKIISEYEEAIKKLKELRDQAKTKMAKGGSVDPEEVEHLLMKAQGIKEHHCKCNEKMSRGGHVSKGEMVWRKLSSSKKIEFLNKNFTPEITPRSQELLVGKAYNFLPKNVKIKLEANYANVEEYAKGGGVSDGEIKIKGFFKNFGFNVEDIQRPEYGNGIEGWIVFYDNKNKYRVIDYDVAKYLMVYDNTTNKTDIIKKSNSFDIDSFANGGGVKPVTYYVAYNSYFDTNKYDVDKIKKALTSIGATDIHLENEDGQSNQPEVVVFNYTGDGTDYDPTKAVQKAFDTDWIIIRVKDWRTKKMSDGGGVSYRSRDIDKIKVGDIVQYAHGNSEYEAEVIDIIYDSRFKELSTVTIKWLDNGKIQNAYLKDLMLSKGKMANGGGVLWVDNFELDQDKKNRAKYTINYNRGIYTIIDNKTKKAITSFPTQISAVNYIKTELNKFESGGGVYSSDDLYELLVHDVETGVLLGVERFRAKNVREANEMGEEFEDKYKKRFRENLRFKVQLAPSMFQEKGGNMANGGSAKSFEIGDWVQEKKGNARGQIYEMLGSEFAKLQDKYGNQSNTLYHLRNFKASSRPRYEYGGVVGQSIKFDHYDETMDGYISEITDAGDYVVHAGDRTLLVSPYDVISLGEVKKRKRFGLFEDGGSMYGRGGYLVTYDNGKKTIIRSMSEVKSFLKVLKENGITDAEVTEKK